ncbi:glycosyltransferase [Ferrimonas balearica]|uniref:glycosyltransferase n=1 Tax=Ferrimonas balearica TaxID=44012 RepID=UPI001C99759C|nr:glycosyltransferase [Ferrimonas balearica]MBY5991441.1 glycosyltransferase [Ferrimonas balearica]
MLFAALVAAAAIGLFLFRLFLLERDRVHIGVDRGEHSDWPFVSVIIPARNEEANIPTALGSLVAQDYPQDRYEVVVVDDFSEDNTRALVERIAAQSAVPVRCVSGRPLPKGWFGKSNACMVGAQHARGDYLFFVDADTQSEPEMLRSVTRFALAREIDLLSFNPRQRMESFAERTWLPGLFLGIASFMRFGQSNDPDSEEAIANGQAMMFRRDAYWAVDGHQVVAGEISEDLAFARAMKQRGFRLFWAFADDLMSTRMYTNREEIWLGFSKNMNRIIQCRSRTHAAVLLARALMLAWTPPALWLAALGLHLGGAASAMAVTTVAAGVTLAVVITAVKMLSALQVPLRYFWALPLGLSMQGMLVVNAYRLADKAAITWKGRKVVVS